MYEHGNIEKEKDTEKYEHFLVTYGEFFPWRKYGVHNKTTHWNSKMDEEINPDIMTSIDTKCRVLKDGKLWTSKKL